MISSLPHHENVRQQIVNHFWHRILGNQVIVQLLEFTLVLLTTFIGKSTIYKRQSMDSKMIHITTCKTWNKWQLDTEYMILIRYYNQTAKAGALYESTDRHAGQPADNPFYSSWLRDLHQTIHKLKVGGFCRPRPPICKQFCCNLDPDPKQWSGTVCISRLEYMSNTQCCSDAV